MASAVDITIVSTTAMKMVFEELAPRLKSLDFNGQPSRSEGSFVAGPKRVPIRYQMA